MKKIVLLFAFFGFVFQTMSCKSNKAQDETEIVENADVEKIEAEDTDLLTQAETTTDVGPVDTSLQEVLGETSGQAAADPALETTDIAVTETTTPAPEIATAPVLDENSLTSSLNSEVTASSTDSLNLDTDTSLQSSAAITETPVSEPASTVAPPAAPTEITEAPVTETNTVTASTSETAVAPKISTGKSSLKKIAETTPYQFGDGWVNTVYIARPNETLKEISQKIYGMNKTKELKKINSFLVGKEARAGNKIYYVSPNRPTDSTKTLSFYEDTGMIAENYVAKKGENFKKVSKNLLGYDNAYIEVWSTNPVASYKDRLEEGETLRYWQASTAIAPTLASNNEMPKMGGAQVIESTDQLPSQPIAQNNMQNATPPPQAELPPPPPEQNNLPPPPPEQMAQNTTPPTQAELPPPPPPPDMGQSAAEVAAMTPPPPPPEEVAVAPQKKTAPDLDETGTTEGMSEDTTMMLGGAVVLCGLLAFTLIRRNKKKKEVEMSSMSETNVGT